MVSEGESYYRDQAIRWLMKRIKIAPKWNLMPGAVSYQAVVGPAGVGKSSLVAKLAALYAVREKRQVAVVSLDNHRLAASEQMRIFCKIIGVPFVAAATPADVFAVPETHRDVELVLIDTAGVSPKGLGRIGELQTLKEAGSPVDVHLALSVTEKDAQLDQAVRSFSRLGLASLAFTKLDESWAFGGIFNLSKKWALPLSFFAIGQQIPDDVERASRERVIERLFGL
jgi:flagellar biosynthesis protein FlhF